MIAIQTCTLRPGVTAPQVARRYVHAACQGLDREVQDDVTLMVSELVTNAVVHGEGEIELRIETEDERVRVAVTDGGREPVGSVGRMPGTSQLRGRGLAIVDRLSDRWGVEHRPDDGKTVWFERPAR